MMQGFEIMVQGPERTWVSSGVGVRAPSKSAALRRARRDPRFAGRELRARVAVPEVPSLLAVPTDAEIAAVARSRR